MNLFHKYHSRSMQFSADLFALLDHKQNGISLMEAQKIGLRYGIQGDFSFHILQLLCQAEFLCVKDKKYFLNRDFFIRQPPAFPLSTMEKDYLQVVLRSPFVHWFLEEQTIEKLWDASFENPFPSCVDSLSASGKKHIPEVSSANFRLIMQAADERKAIRYQYITDTCSTYREAVAYPWKLECSAFDNRIWIVLYSEERGNTIKAWLDHIEAVEILPDTHIDDQTIQKSYQSLLAPEPIVLHIQNDKNAIERTFMSFEQQALVSAHLEKDQSCVASFQYFRYDEQELLHQLLFLGACVQLVSPASLKKKYLDLIDQALNNMT